LKVALWGLYRLCLFNFRRDNMNRIFLSLLALAAIALVVGQAVAGSGAQNATPNATGVMVVETYSSSATVPENDMQPLPGNPGVEVAPVDSSTAQPVEVEEDMLVEESED
jgi:hypothetical protein